MMILYVDEAGYAPNWQHSMGEQPFYILAGVLMPGEAVGGKLISIRDSLEGLDLPKHDYPLGQGYEIKGLAVAKGGGWWGTHSKERNKLRETMLEIPARCEGAAILIAIDKKAHEKRYEAPENPYKLALSFLFERVQRELEKRDETAVAVLDNNRRAEQKVRRKSSKLIREGSRLGFWGFDGQWQQHRQEIDRIIEVCFSDSRYSFGLQVADFFASMAYSYYKSGQPEKCGWWETLRLSLAKSGSRVKGIGLKEFP